MHSLYLFILDDIKKDSSAKDISARFEELYVDDYCDENNWYQEEVFVHRDGTVVPMCPADDYRGRDTFARELESMKPDERIPYLLTLAMKMTAGDIGLFNASNLSLVENEGDRKINSLSRAELIKIVEDNHEVLIIAPMKDDSIPGFLRFWRTKKNVGIIEAFMDSNIKPFGIYPTTPYDGPRCFDLRSDPKVADQISEGEGILAVDIHT